MTTLSVLDAADESPDGSALVVGDDTTTYGELAARVRSRILGLRALGARAGEPLGLVARIDERTVTTILAAIELGAPLVLLHPRWTAPERARAVAIARPTRVLEDEAPHAGGTFAPRPVSDDATLAIVFSSGTSGDPRAAVLSRGAFRRASAASAAVLGWTPGDRWLCPMPLAHVGGLSIVVRSLLARRAIVLPPVGSFDPDGFVATLRASEATIVSVVPTMLARIASAGISPPRTVRVVLVGGAVCPPRVLREAAALGWPLRTTYGLTEACAQVTTARTNVRDPSDGCGLPLPGVEVRIESERILVRTPSAMDGWLRTDGTLDRPFDADGFYDTGDDGRLDELGRLHVLGRRTDLVVTGGENVRPAEVEAALEAIPGIRAACVFGVPDERWGAVVAAAIVAEEHVSDAEIDRSLRERLAPFKLPRALARVPTLATSPTGKIDRRATAAMVLAAR